MGIDNIEFLIDKGESMTTFEPPEDPNRSTKPVDDPDLPEEGDPDEFEEEPVPDEDFSDAEADEPEDAEPEEPNDLSEVDKEFEEDN